MRIGTRLKVKRGDTSPQFRAQCLGGTSAAPVDLTGAAAVLVVRGEHALVARRLVAVVEGGTAGWVHRDWQAGELDVTGVLRGEVEVTFSDGRVQTFPAEGYVTIEVVEDLD